MVDMSARMFVLHIIISAFDAFLFTIFTFSIPHHISPSFFSFLFMWTYIITSFSILTFIRYLVGKYLGVGGFASCYVLTSQQSGQSYAGKFLRNSAMNEDQRKKLRTEIRIHRTCVCFTLLFLFFFQVHLSPQHTTPTHSLLHTPSTTRYNLL